MALENHGAVEARALNGLAVHNHHAFAGRIQPRQNIKHGGLAATRMADHAREFTARYRQPEIFEDRDLIAARMWISLGDRFDRNEFVGHGVIPETSPCG